MRILLVHPRMNILGGGERVAVHSIAAALKGDHEVYLLSENLDVENFEDFFDCHGLLNKVQHLAYPGFKPALRTGFLLYQRLHYHQSQHNKLLSQNHDFDLVLSTQDVGYVPSIQSPVIQYCYFPEYFSHLQSHPSSPWWRMYYWPASRFYRKKVRQVDRLLSVSEFTRSFVRRIWGRESTTLYPPCPVEQYTHPDGAREDLVVSIGRIVPEKRFHLFLDIARSLPSHSFAIIGSVAHGNARYYEWLQKNAPKNVSLVLSPLRKVKAILARAKSYVHCAESEHFGIAIVEAMAAGCIPVVHDSGGPREVVTEDVGYRWRDVSEAASQISRLSEDDELRQKLSVGASSRARLFRPEIFESKLAKVLGEYEH